MKEAALSGAKEQLHQTIRNSLPEGRMQQVYSSYMTHDSYLDENPAAEEEFKEGEFKEDEGPTYNMYLDTSLTFEFPDEEQNIMYAAAAYRLYGTPKCIVAREPRSGLAFFGDPGDLVELCEHRNVDPSDFEVLEDPSDIMQLETSYDAVQDLVGELHNDPAYEEAKTLFDKFHWGDKSKVASFVEIPGIEGDLTLLGVGRQIQYGAKKGGTWTEYYHDFGEKTKVYPLVYALGENTLVIHGGKMRVEPRGIVE